MFQYQHIREQTQVLCKPLNIEDYVIQAMPDVSPAKWHLAHVTWFFEFFLLIPFLKDYQIFCKEYEFIFNSYYEALGNYSPRATRGTLSRPTVEEIYQYRHYVDEAMQSLLEQKNNIDDVNFRLALGLNHEQQHQELLLMDIKYNFSQNPLYPIYANKLLHTQTISLVPMTWQSFPAALYEIGYEGEDFAYDNEYSRHKVYLNHFQLSNRLVTNAEYLEFIEADAYNKPLYWLADGWQTVKSQQWQAPLYWKKIANKWWEMTLYGLQPLIMEEPVSHISYYEADAYARFVNARLPSEAEWEVAASVLPINGSFLEANLLKPSAPKQQTDLQQMFGELWQWTQSPYQAYPGYIPFKPPLTEYNNKFTCNQFVLRGGSVITPSSHFRITYRNFFYPQQRWAFTGIRLARDI